MSMKNILEKDYVVIVDEQESASLQEKLFDCNYCWQGNSDQYVKHTERKFLFVKSDGTISYLDEENPDFYTLAMSKYIPVEKLIKKLQKRRN